MSASIAAHELIYTSDAYGANGRLHHLAFWVDTREECPRAADMRVEVPTGGYFVFGPEQPTVVWTEAERAKGQAWGARTVETFRTYGTPPVG